VTDKPQEPKQTTPKGLDTPIPKRRDVMDAFKRIAMPKPKHKQP
jgi:hypothetical protein